MADYKVKLAEETISREELNELCGWLSLGERLTKSPLTDQFEAAFAASCGSKHALFVNSGSSANLLALYALAESGRLSSRAVVAPAVSWVTTVTPAVQFGMPVYLCDCDRQHLGLDLDHLEQLLKKYRPGVVMAVHVLGHVTPLAELAALTKRYGAFLIEDSCEALGTAQNQRRAGTVGSFGTFSFYYGHQMSTIEGGMLVTDDLDLYLIAKSLRAHGWSRDLPQDVSERWEKEHGIDAVRRLYTFYYPGFNCRSTDLNAFVGLSQLRRLPEFVAARQRNFEHYVASLPEYWSQKSDFDVLSSLAYGTLVENRVAVYQNLSERGIECRPLICGSIGLQPFWTRRFGATQLPNADIVHEHGIYLPNHHTLTNNNIEDVAEAFRQVAIPAFWK